MKDHHVSLRNSGIAVLAPVCMVFIQDGTSAIVQILCKDNRDIGTLVSLLSYITAIILALCLYISNPWIFTTSDGHKHNVCLCSCFPPAFSTSLIFTDQISWHPTNQW